MGRYFETDGIRGRFNKNLTIDLALKVAMSAASVLGEGADVCIGKDPRISSDVIENALVAGLTAGGVNVYILGTVTTPNISHAVRSNSFAAGIMISASHNPYYDNGIKFFGPDGMKLGDTLEAQIEDAIDKNEFTFNDNLGKTIQSESYKNDYVDFLINNGTKLTGMKIGLDCANGSAYEVAVKVFKELGANVVVIGNEPNGVNINNGIGSTHPEKLAQLVKDKNLDFGFAFDGDADRIILVDHEGEVLDGDYIIYLLTKYYKNRDELNNNICVGTVMANLGFKAALKEIDVEFSETQVGDRFVMQRIAEQSATVGGEQSGHIILPNILPTGDGVLTAVILAKIFKRDTTALHNLRNELTKFPQVLINIVVEDKDKIMSDAKLKEMITEVEASLEGSGRILIRQSGTESLVRVMVEAKTQEDCESVAAPFVEYINNL